MLEMRAARAEDIDRVMEVYAAAQEYMIASGNPTQWRRAYPARELIEADVAAGRCRIITEGGEIHAVAAICGGEDPAYPGLTGGSWLNDEPYITIHRIASDGKCRGVFRFVADECKRLCGNVRVDTHENNRKMRENIAACGFIPCGTVFMADGSPRLAFHWSKEYENKERRL